MPADLEIGKSAATVLHGSGLSPVLKGEEIVGRPLSDGSKTASLTEVENLSKTHEIEPEPHLHPPSRHEAAELTSEKEATNSPPNGKSLLEGGRKLPLFKKSPISTSKNLLLKTSAFWKNVLQKVKYRANNILNRIKVLFQKPINQGSQSFSDIHSELESEEALSEFSAEISHENVLEPYPTSMDLQYKLVPLPEEEHEKFEKSLVKAAKILSKPPPEPLGILKADRLSEQFAQNWRESLLPEYASQPEMAAEIKQTATALKKALLELQKEASFYSDVTKFGKELSESQNVISKGLHKTLGDSTLRVLKNDIVQKTSKALEKLDSKEFLKEFSPKVTAFVDLFIERQKQVIVNGLSTNQAYQKIMQTQLDNSEKLHKIISDSLSSIRPQDVQAFGEAKATAQANRALKDFDVESRGKNLEAAHQKALDKLKPDQLIAKVPPAEDLVPEFYRYKLFKMAETLFEPLHKQKAEYAESIIARKVKSLLQGSIDLKEGYTKIMVSIDNPRSDIWLYKVLSDVNNQKLNPKQLAQKLKTGPNFREQVEDALASSGKTFEIDAQSKLKFAAGKSVDSYLNEVEKLERSLPVPIDFKTAQALYVLREVASQSQTTRPIKIFLNNLLTEGLLTREETKVLSPKLLLSKEQYLKEVDKLGNFETIFRNRIYDKILPKTSIELSEEEKKGLLSKTINTLTKEFLADFNNEARELYLTSKAFEDSSFSFEEAAHLYTAEGTTKFLEDSYYESRIPTIYSDHHFSRFVSPTRVVSGTSRKSSIQYNEALEQEFFDELRLVASEKPPWAQVIESSDNSVLKKVDPRNSIFIEKPLKIGDSRLKGTRFENLDQTTISSINAKAEYLSKHWERIYQAELQERQAGENAKELQKPLESYGLVITRILNKLTDRYTYNLRTRAWDVVP
ncbi:hypothetical protein O181_037298 [Austropuccinia psidii MF-1]|uniref:Uncharacterized protein n=1 Tax=Austropuccinia psidii MF-1 TaxID=1389203 RepID=A0A9Q3D943_9BASI|nr:hypothetical protein [Austropuccinia psidii MF-1]